MVNVLNKVSQNSYYCSCRVPVTKLSHYVWKDFIVTISSIKIRFKLLGLGKIINTPPETEYLYTKCRCKEVFKLSNWRNEKFCFIGISLLVLIIIKWRYYLSNSNSCWNFQVSSSWNNGNMALYLLYTLKILTNFYWNYKLQLMTYLIVTTVNI